MEQLTQFVSDYGPHLLGLAFVILIAFNFRNWLTERKSDADSAK